MSRFEFIETTLDGLKVVQRKVIEDERGFLSRFFCPNEFGEVLLNKSISQINHTLTRKRGTVRGMHFQFPPHSETKIVSCLHGVIFDVAVDLRKNSPTFLQWHGEILTATNRKSLLIPEGFAHGFQALTDDCELIYLHTANYCQSAEGALNVADPRLSINWPLPMGDISDRDRNHPCIQENFEGITI